MDKSDYHCLAVCFPRAQEAKCKLKMEALALAAGVAVAGVALGVALVHTRAHVEPTPRTAASRVSPSANTATRHGVPSERTS